MHANRLRIWGLKGTRRADRHDGVVEKKMSAPMWNKTSLAVLSGKQALLY